MMSDSTKRIQAQEAEAFHRWGLPIASEDTRPDDLKRFYNLRASEEVCPKHRNSRRESAGWDRVDHQELFVLC